jgi:YegS/Rv2252/BmrU family lipid kinase
VNVTLLVNPAAGRHDGVACVPELVRLLAPLGAVAAVLATSLTELTTAARAAAAEGHTLIVAGGDGTIHHVVNALTGVPSTIGILPSGSGNDLARALGLPLDIEAAAARLAQGRTRRADLAEVNGRLFCTVGGTGLIARSTGDVSRWIASKSPFRTPARAIGGNAYLISAALHILLTGSLDEARVSGEGPSGRWSWQGSAHTIIVANQRQMGQGLTLPIAGADEDGVLEVCIVPRRGRLSLVTKLAALRTGSPLGPAVLHVDRATTARIELERPCPFAADGEVLFEDRTFDVRVRPSALQVLV